MPLKGKHVFKKLKVSDTEEVFCTIVETKIPKERVDFLKDLLEVNGFEVVVIPDKKKSDEDPDLFTLGVTDLTFNPVIQVFERKLLTKDGRKITADYWNQISDDTIPQYWESV